MKTQDLRKLMAVPHDAGEAFGLDLILSSGVRLFCGDVYTIEGDTLRVWSGRTVESEPDTAIDISQIAVARIDYAPGLGVLYPESQAK